MQQISCDKCGKTVATTEVRYRVKWECQAISPPTPPDDDDRDSVDAMEEFLCEPNPPHARHDAETLEMPLQQTEHEFDLCSSCYHKFQTDPLGRDTTRRATPFSRN